MTPAVVVSRSLCRGTSRDPGRRTGPGIGVPGTSGSRPPSRATWRTSLSGGERARIVMAMRMTVLRATSSWTCLPHPCGSRRTTTCGGSSPPPTTDNKVLNVTFLFPLPSSIQQEAGDISMPLRRSCHTSAGSPPNAHALALGPHRHPRTHAAHAVHEIRPSHSYLFRKKTSEEVEVTLGCRRPRSSIHPPPSLHAPPPG